MSSAHPHPTSALQIALTGALALSIAMGIGRFAFTPLLPMMLADGVVDLAGASWLASANYFGYLVGALLCTFGGAGVRRLGLTGVLGAASRSWGTVWIRTGLLATCVLTLCMALPLPWAWPALRFAAGVGSALVFVFSSSWCLTQLAQRGSAALGAVMYTGPGAGIAVSGLLASSLVALKQSAAAGWLIFALLAAALTAVIWRQFAPAEPALAPGASPAAVSTGSNVRLASPQMLLLALAYGLAGLGYIITATFLPVIARAALPASSWLDLFWPLFGVAVIAGALLASRVSPRTEWRYALAAAYTVQASGVALTAFWPTLAGFALGSVLIGLPFTALTFFAVQEVRRLRPVGAASAASGIGLLTAVYGAGQIAGPLLTAALLARSSSVASGFALALEVATAALALGVVMFLALVKLYPREAVR